jgi:outer membrane protein OmpA-like peptidoglycan-associated protein
MKHIFATTMILTGALLAGGCASKKYVRNTTAPIQAKLDQVGEQTNKNSQAIEQTNAEVKQVDQKAQAGISGAKEAAMTADNHAKEADSHAGEAMTKANQANEGLSRTNQDLRGLRSQISNLDDYKQAKDATIPFKFNQYRLTDDDRQQLDQLVSDVSKYKRYFVTVKGYTDQTGSAEYNEGLSRRRADAVMEYLVGRHNVPLYRIHMLGLGQMNPVDSGRTSAARAKNRRVEVTVYCADQVIAQAQSN